MARAKHGWLDPSNAIGRYGVAYVRKVCAHAHVPFTEGSPGEDIFAIDGTIEYPEGGIRVQIKATTRWPLDSQREPLRFPVKESWRDKWRQSLNPAYLIVVLIAGPELDNWIRYEELTTVLNSYALWARIDDLDAAATIVELHRRRRFTARTIGEWHKFFGSQYGIGTRSA